MTTSTIFIPEGYILIPNVFVLLFGFVLMAIVVAGAIAFLSHMAE
jgi:hypothetical protein